MRKKIALGLIAVVAVIGGIIGIAAYEAHVINVTATIENALSVDATPIDFGTVFPQEIVVKEFTVSLSQSFLAEDRVDDVDYDITSKPKPGFSNNLCPFLSKMNEEEDEDEAINENDFDSPSYYIPASPAGPARCSKNQLEASGRLSKMEQDTQDRWVVDLKVPPIEGTIGQDWPEDCPTIPVDSGDWGCDLWVEVAGISEEIDRTGLAALWHLYENRGDIVHDSSGNENHGAIYGASWTDRALTFDGIDDYAEIPDDPSLDFETGNFSVEVWIKVESYFGSVFLNKGTDIQNWRLELQGESHQIVFEISDESGGPSLQYNYDYAGQWIHLVGVRDGDVLKLYINGELADTITGEGGINPNNNSSLIIGTNFMGLIDEVLIYNKALSGDEVRKLWERL